MPTRRFVCLVSSAAVCLQLLICWPQPGCLSHAAEAIDKPTQAPAEPSAPAKKDAASDAAVKPAPKPDEEEFELLELFADTLDQVERNYVKDVSRRQLMEAAIRGMLSELDPYSNFIPPKQLDRFKVEVENEFGGVGIQVSTENGQLQVISPLVGTPAYRAGVIAGDLITEIGGESTKGITLDEAVQRMKGAVGTKVKVKVLHAGAMEPEEIELERENIRVETVLGGSRNPDDSWRWMFDPEKKIAYVRITGFGRHTSEDLKKVMQPLADQKLRGLILDLRFNPGGLLSSAIEVSDMFVAQGRIVSTEGRNVEPRAWEAEEKGTFADFPMAVLVNRYSASASEIVAACLQDHNRAVIIGERTWGKGSVQNIIEMEGGASALKLTTAGYHRPNGKNIHKYPGAKDSDDWGVIPNPGYEVKLSSKEMMQLIAQRRENDIVRKQNAEAKPDAPFFGGIVDVQLQKAIDYINAQLDAQKPPHEPAGKKEPKAETKPEAKPETKPEGKPEAESKPEPKTEEPKKEEEKSEPKPPA